MKIYREVDGIRVEFELTDEEMREAYCEQEKKYDLEDVRCTVDYDYVCDAEHIRLKDGSPVADHISKDEWESDGFRRVAALYRHYMNNDETYWYNVRNAADEILREMAKEKGVA